MNLSNHLEKSLEPSGNFQCFSPVDLTKQQEKMQNVLSDTTLHGDEKLIKVNTVLFETLGELQKFSIRSSISNAQLTDKIDLKSREMGVLQEEVSDLKKKLDTQEKELESYDKEVLELNKEIQDQGKEVSVLNAAKRDLENRVNTLNQNILARNTKIANRVDVLVDKEILKHKKAAEGRGVGVIVSGVVGGLATAALIVIPPAAAVVAAATITSTTTCAVGEGAEKGLSNFIKEKKSNGVFNNMEEFEAVDALKKMKKEYEDSLKKK